MSKNLRWIIALFAASMLIAILYTDPLIFHLSTLFPGLGQSDTPLSVWNIWHLKKTIFSGHNFFTFRTNYIFFPQSPSLALHNYGITTGLMSLPLQLFFEPIVSRNLLFLMQFAFTAVGMYLMVFYFTNNRRAAFYSALTLAFCPYVIIRSYNYLHFSTIWFLPWFIYFLWRFLESSRLRYSVSSGIVLALCLLNDQTYFIFLAFFAICALIFFISAKRHCFAGAGPLKLYLRNFSIGIFVFLIISFPYIIALAKEMMNSETSLFLWYELCVNYFSLHIQNLFRPSPLLALYRDVPYLPMPMSHVTNVFIGYIPLFLAFYALLKLPKEGIERRKAMVFWMLTTLLFIIIALGPMPFGKGNHANKFALYNLICKGPLQQLRIPVRFSLIGIIGIYILAGFGLDKILSQGSGKSKQSANLFVFLIILQMIEFFPAPYPLLNLEVPIVYRALAAQKGNAPILVLPLGWQSSYKTIGPYYKRIQFYQTIHQRPLFQGQIARIEDSSFDYYLSDKGFKYLMEADSRMPTTEEKNRVYAIINRYGIRNIIIHKQYFDKKHLDMLLDMFREYKGDISVDVAP